VLNSKEPMLRMWIVGQRMGAAEQGAGGGRWEVSPRTLIFLMNGDDVLLMKRGPHKRIFPNKYNGLGGHVERGEDIYSAAAREVQEESGLTAHNLRLRGVHHIDAGADSGIMVFVFTASCASRKLIDCDEGTLEWVNRDQVSVLDLVEDLPEVLPRVLRMADDALPYFAHVRYDEFDTIRIRYG
jgi:8-oxo-dGTP diphosphatase